MLQPTTFCEDAKFNAEADIVCLGMSIIKQMESEETMDGHRVFTTEIIASVRTALVDGRVMRRIAIRVSIFAQ